jgi:hypothetical protein
MHGSLPALVVTERADAIGESIDKPADDDGATVAPVPPPAEVKSHRRRWRRLLVGLSAIVLLAVVLSLSWFGWWRPSDGTVAGNPAAEKRDLAHILATEFPASQIPYGYRFRAIEPFCCRSDEKEKSLGIESYSRVYFVRDDLPQPKPSAYIPSWEGFNYIVFVDSSRAARFTLADLDSLLLVKLMLGDDDAIAKQFNERAWRGTVTVQISSMSGPQQLPCYVADTLIGCLVRSPNPRVLYQLLLQEPKLREARTGEARQNIVKARVQKEGGLLMRAAEEHVKWAERQADR